ncbi:TonB-dependent receptor [uncultured Sphingomonas sp.]|uniref:TonB-dependent receptor n=1 Tax=uncultured Sphingomonas sp. TaxID=158754 RepID=UPI0025EEC0C2|nr:TonB-dependent receptor [uncultured Sphingomonas sp.]
MMMRRWTLLLAGTALLPATAWAQDAAPPAEPATATAASDDSAVGDIIVTGQKTSERLSRAPIAISVVSQDTLTRQGVDSATALATTVPNLQLSANGFAVRGIGSNNSFSGYSTVATQIDGIYEPSAQALSFGLYDLGAVEVLRGPQGTVYGRNATAGVVNINTADPRKTRGVTADLQLGRFNEVRARAAVDLPVSDAFRLRFAAYRQVDDGVDDHYAARHGYGKTDQSGLRVTSLLDVGPVTWRLSLNYGRNEGTIPASYLTSINTYPQGNLAAGTFGPRQVIETDALNVGQAAVTDNRMDLEYYSARSRLAWQVADGLSLTYLAGYTLLKNDGIDAATGVFTQESIDRRTESWSHEVDVNYDRGILNLVVGGFLYQDRQPSGTRLLHAGDTAPAPFNTVYNLIGAKVRGTGTGISTISGVDVVTSYRGQGTKSQAVFGQGTLEILPGLKLIGGIRSTWEQVNARNIELVCPGDTINRQNITATTCPGIPFVFALSNDTNRPEAKFDNISWKVGANYEVSPTTLVYATVSTGFRGGGLEASGNAPQFRQYRPETVTNYEAGVRTTLLDGKLYLSATGFNMEYKDLQVSSIVLNPLTNQVSAVTTNAATARLRGIELEASLRPTPADRISGYVSYLDARIKSFPTASDNLNSASGNYNAFAPAFGFRPLPSNLSIDASGNRLANAPEWSGRFSYAHTFDLSSGGRVIPSVDFYAQSHTYSDVQNYAQSRRDAYTKTDLNLRFEDADDRYSITAFVNNVEDSRVPNTLVTVWSSTTANYDPPRTYGVRLGMNLR